MSHTTASDPATVTRYHELLKPGGEAVFYESNPWNIVLAMVMAAWAKQRSREGLKWDLPGGTVFLLLLYFLIVVVGFVRFANDHSGVDYYVQVRGGEMRTFAGMVSEFFINCIKWVIPGLLLFDGVRDRSRMKWAMFSVLFIYVALAIQVIRWMPLSTLTTGADLGARSLKILMREVGYHRVNIAVILAGVVVASMRRPVQSPR